MENWEKDILEGLKKNKKRLRLKLNQINGGLGEQLVAGDYTAKGFIIKRSPRGQDFIAYERDDLLNLTGRKLFIEVKTGNAKFSPLQKVRKKEKGKRFVSEKPF